MMTSLQFHDIALQSAATAADVMTQQAARVEKLEAALKEVAHLANQWSKSSKGGFAALRTIAKTALDA